VAPALRAPEVCQVRPAWVSTLNIGAKTREVNGTIVIISGGTFCDGGHTSIVLARKKTPHSRGVSLIPGAYLIEGPETQS
jgi:hypothetical protein